MVFINWITHVINVPIYIYTTQDLESKEDGSTDYKSGQKFADHIKGDSEAVSSFAKNRTMKQQREFLPIFAVREQVNELHKHYGTCTCT